MAALAAAALLVAACGAADETDTGSVGAPPGAESPGVSGAPSAGEPTVTETTLPPASSSSSSSSTTTVPGTTSTPGTTSPAPGTDPIAVAVADLAARLGVDPSAIAVVSAEEVTWPDAAIGCPQPGMSYAQVLVNGSRIVLEAGGLEYHYHSGGGEDPFFCADPQDPVPGGGDA